MRGRAALPGTREPPAEPWQRQAYDSWVGRLGTERMEGFLRGLRGQLETLLSLTFDDIRDRQDRLAHDVASSAGMLGFLEVTRLCRDLQAARSEDAGEAAFALRKGLKAALACIERHFAIGVSAAQAA